MAECLSFEEHVEPGAAGVAIEFSIIIFTTLILITDHTANHNLTNDTGNHERGYEIFKEAVAPSAQRCW